MREEFNFSLDTFFFLLLWITKKLLGTTVGISIRPRWAHHTIKASFNSCDTNHEGDPIIERRWTKNFFFLFFENLIAATKTNKNLSLRICCLLGLPSSVWLNELSWVLKFLKGICEISPLTWAFFCSLKISNFAGLYLQFTTSHATNLSEMSFELRNAP